MRTSGQHAQAVSARAQCLKRLAHARLGLYRVPVGRQGKLVHLGEQLVHSFVQVKVLLKIARTAQIAQRRERAHDILGVGNAVFVQHVQHFAAPGGHRVHQRAVKIKDVWLWPHSSSLEKTRFSTG